MKIKIFILLISVVLVTSCNKWLDVDLADKVTEEKMFSTPQGYTEALAGVYSAMAASNLYGQSLTMENIDLLAQYYNYDGVSTTYEKLKNYDYEDAGSQSRIAAIWRNMYAAISGANNIIKWAGKTDNVLSSEMKNQVLGEAYALRAYLHFDLIRMFCPDVKNEPKAKGIPYNTVFGVSLPPIYTVEENVQLVVNDLKEAEKYLVNDPINGVAPYTMVDKNSADKYVARMNLYSVKAMLARVSLMRGDKNSAIQYAKEVVESGKFRLLDFASTDKSEKEIDILFSDEHIFSLRNKNLSDYTIYLHYPEITSTSSRSAYLPFVNVSTMYEGNNDDVRYIKWFSVINGNFTKFNVDNKVKFFPKMPMIKLSEMYLILSECYLGKDDVKAQSYINTLRNHRIRNNTNWGYLTMDYITQEAKREFIGEGQLLYMYKRLNMGVPTSSGIVGVVPPSDKIFVFPMPLKEIETGNRN
ncbi:MAG TPA: RagB/SusD family nutrient uptake outer membrane protein [Niabella sp.]|nr:RagB/SusD family nutrient uptake outer membrane protein [Chitinophagaceae bacterium]HRN46670.1 RagB/SusD family nutrient uptake outer membrane protein [Niabella sp.]HRO84605.1 RagB/SusD family nutrient uptake outer membrane protein [Niabella sp.]